MIRKYHLYDKFFVEYHTKADQHVLLNYSVNGGEYHKEEIPEVYDGIYVKAFVLLFGESVSYYISEKLHGEKAGRSQTRICMGIKTRAGMM